MAQVDAKPIRRQPQFSQMLHIGYAIPKIELLNGHAGKSLIET